MALYITKAKPKKKISNLRKEMDYDKYRRLDHLESMTSDIKMVGLVNTHGF
jgi:hypothetical protein